MRTWGTMRPAYSYQTLPSKMRYSALGLPRHREGEVEVQYPSYAAPPPPLSRPPRPSVSRSLSLSQSPRTDTSLQLPRQATARRMARSQSVYSVQESPASLTLPFQPCSTCGSPSWRPELEDEEVETRPEPSPLSKLGYNSIKSRSLVSLHQASLSMSPSPLMWPLARTRYSSTGHLAIAPAPPPHANILTKSQRSSSARNLLLLNESYQDCKCPVPSWLQEYL